MPTLLIIGHGYLGSSIAALARDSGWKVYTASRHGEGSTHKADLTSLCSLHYLAEATGEPEYVIHCASSARGGGAEAYREVYQVGCQNLTKAFPNSHILFTSSTSVYGQTDKEIVTEDSDTFPQRETGEILLTSEKIILDHHGTVARLAGIYGPGRSIYLKRILTGEAVIEGEGDRLLNQIHRNDAASACLHLLNLGDASQGQIYNVCDSTPLTQFETYQALADHHQLPLPPHGSIDKNTKRGWTDKSVSNAKLLATGWQPAFPSYIHAIESLR